MNSVFDELVEKLKQKAKTRFELQQTFEEEHFTAKEQWVRLDDVLNLLDEVKQNYYLVPRKKSRGSVKKFVHGKKYRFKEDYYYKQPYPLKSITIPKGTIVTFDCPNLGFARFIVNWKLAEKLETNSISLKPKDAFNILEPVEEELLRENELS